MPKQTARRKRKSAAKDPFEPLRQLPSEEKPMLADVLMQAVLDEEGVSSPAVDEALLRCSLRIHQESTGMRTVAAASIHQLMGGFYEEEERDREAARHYRAALQSYARDPDAAAHFPLALENYQRILSRMGKRAEARREARRFKKLARQTMKRRT